MSNIKNKRNHILEYWINQLRSIPFEITDGIKLHIDNAYICPLCLRAFCIDDSGGCTLEHVPPKAVGGKPIVITCKDCNNNLGADIDAYLFNEIEMVYNLSHLYSVPQKSVIAFNGISINGQTTFSKESGFLFMVKPDNNSPKVYERFMSEIKNSKEGYQINLSANITNHKRNVDLANVAVLKSAYLMAFQQLGYMYILNSNLDIVRRQINNPDEYILNHAYFIGNENDIPNKQSDGVFYAKVDSIACIAVFLSLKLQKSDYKHRVAVALPHPDDTDGSLYSRIINSSPHKHVDVCAPVTHLPLKTKKLMKLSIKLYDNARTESSHKSTMRIGINAKQ